MSRLPSLALIGLVLLTGGCKRARGLLNVETDAATPLEASREGPNGLVRAHYPRSFAANVQGQSVVVLSRNVTLTEDEGITLVSVETPISDDVQEFGRVVLDAEERKMTEITRGYKESARRTTKCFGDDVGLETEATFVTTSGDTYFEWGCTFLHAGHGYSFKWVVTERSRPTHEALIRKIVSATELLEPKKPSSDPSSE